MSDDIPLFWSAGGGKGWPQADVFARLREVFDFPERVGYFWRWGTPFMINPRGLAPFVITSDPAKAQVLALSDQDYAYLPALMGDPVEPPPGYSERHCGASDPWLMNVP